MVGFFESAASVFAVIRTSARAAAKRSRIAFSFIAWGIVTNKATRFTELGAGNVDLRSAIHAALQVQPEWLVYEQDTSYERNPVESATESLQCLRQLVTQA